MCVRPFGRQTVGVRLGNEYLFGVAAVCVPSGEASVRTKVLVSATTPPTGAAGGSEPGNADPVPDGTSGAVGSEFGDEPDDLVSRCDLWVSRG
jgi:hypothetical protein